MKGKKIAIIFDFDNTIVKSNIDFPAMKIAMARFAKKNGFDLGVKEKDIPTKFTAGKIIDEAKQFDEKNQTNLAAKLWEIVVDFERRGMENVAIDEEIYSVLERCKENDVCMSILTNNAKQPTIEVLDRFNITKYFDLIVAREDIIKMKPDKEGVELIINKLALDTENVFVVGDSWVDGAAATNANVRFILFREDALDPSKYNIKIWKRITSMKELIDLLKVS